MVKTFVCSITIDIDNVNKVSKVNKVRIKRRLFNRITVVKVSESRKSSIKGQTSKHQACKIVNLKSQYRKSKCCFFFKPFIKFTIVHSAAFLYEEFSAFTGIAVTRHRRRTKWLPVTTRWTITTPFLEFLYVQQSPQLNHIKSPVAVFGNLNMCFAFCAFALFIGVYFIRLRSINKQYHISILFNGTRFTQVSKHRNFAFFSRFNSTI